MLREVESRCEGTRPGKDSELERYVTRRMFEIGPNYVTRLAASDASEF